MHDQLIDPVAESMALEEELGQAYFHWRPRPDQPDRFDEQQSFYESDLQGVAFMIGGNGAGTSETACAKVAKFVLRDQPPPRRDTPYWVIGDSYEQVMESMWKEKFLGHGHIPKSEVDWDRITWYREKEGLPYRVPLRPWPGRPGCNWVLEFKSYIQGRGAMQARSIGGFLFSEQFPWQLLTEVLRGCREYNFRGSKLVEFTPIDPALSYELETLIEENRLPKGWAIFRANTECAKEAGHVSSVWFDEFFGQIPDEMLLTRLTGEFASYEGTIYQGFNPKVHLVGDTVIDHPDGGIYRRSIDWGAGPDNAFCCLWAYRNGLGQWFVYDEYYSTNQSFTVMDHLDAIKARHEWPDIPGKYGTTYADPSAPDCIRIAQRWGFFVTPARNAVHEGIDCVRYHLKKIDGLGQPRLFIHRENCPNLARQMRSYRWMKASDRGLNPRDAPPEPLKREDHAPDALRYLLFTEQSHTGETASSFSRPREPDRHGVLLSGRRR